MLQTTYFQQNQNSGTTNTKLLEEKERLLNSLASLNNNIETPTSLNPEGGYFFIQPRNIIPPTSFFNASEGINFFGAENRITINSVQITSAPMLFWQPLTIPQSETLSLNSQEAYSLIKRSFESYKLDTRQYTLQRAEEIMSFIEDDDNE